MLAKTVRVIRAERKFVPNVPRAPFITHRSVFICPKNYEKVHWPHRAVAEPSVMERISALPKLSFAPIYRVILLEPIEYPKQESIKRLKKAVPSLDVKAVAQIVVTALNTGRAIVITCMIEEAEKYAKTMRQVGLKSTIEQA
jgi:ATP-dependent Clp protease adaptor protein ClpS